MAQPTRSLLEISGSLVPQNSLKLFLNAARSCPNLVALTHGNDHCGYRGTERTWPKHIEQLICQIVG
ncbi:hypothetical protein VFPPC_09708 [Pochonia chlamydosporia 170]|uniref:Uncharacterized protein n=1 Tax=Pochonia chlamydosporia 170 TaxID=1380566 RepID=A0A179FDI8_METCM|nr:hypothetical protein VFPPC_09708 [Pochonia chlamydosporia 170]OAQ63635.1 hypothetical protein VFPPC_09708 [Pochonia chlamydosporia 170]